MHYALKPGMNFGFYTVYSIYLINLNSVLIMLEINLDLTFLCLFAVIKTTEAIVLWFFGLMKKE